MDSGLKLLGSTAFGAGLMYLLDPRLGKRRRALVQDKVVHFIHKAEDAVGPTSRDFRNRIRGVAAEFRSLISSEQNVSDEVLVERIRSELGRVTSHPHAIEVFVSQGCVTLSGYILASEEKRVLRYVSAISGVKNVENRLEVHQEPGNIPSLQGGTGRREPRFELMQTNWSPTARLLSSLAGGTLVYYGINHRGFPGLVFGGVGLSLLARGLTNIEFQRLLGVESGRRAIDIQKTLTIAAPINYVFPFWANYEYFPYFMSYIQEVRDLGGDRSHWVVRGPAGVSIGWDAVLTKFIPNEVLAWKSEPGSTVQHAGIIRFEPTAENNTRIHIQLSYNPPAGAIGHALATALGTDPKRQMDEDLMRMKTFIETGVLPHDAAEKDKSPEVKEAVVGR
jgi:uncharacterized membrane protein